MTGNPNRGFTLLEVLVALAVLGVGTALALSVVSSSLGNIRKVQIKARTIQHAETVMETTLLDGSIQGPTVLRGDFADGTMWSVVVTEVEMPEPEETAAAPNLTLQRQAVAVKPLAYVVEVMEPGSRVPDVRIQTVKLVANPVAPGVPTALPAGQLPGVGR